MTEPTGSMTGSATEAEWRQRLKESEARNSALLRQTAWLASALERRRREAAAAVEERDTAREEVKELRAVSAQALKLADACLSMKHRLEQRPPAAAASVSQPLRQPVPSPIQLPPFAPTRISTAPFNNPHPIHTRPQQPPAAVSTPAATIHASNQTPASPRSAASRPSLSAADQQAQLSPIITDSSLLAEAADADAELRGIDHLLDEALTFVGDAQTATSTPAGLLFTADRDEAPNTVRYPPHPHYDGNSTGGSPFTPARRLSFVGNEDSSSVMATEQQQPPVSDSTREDGVAAETASASHDPVADGDACVGQHDSCEESRIDMHIEEIAQSAQKLLDLWVHGGSQPANSGASA